MGELDGTPYVFAWESEQRDDRGARIVMFRVCYPKRMKDRWAKKIFRDRDEAQEFADRHNGYGVVMRRR